MPTNPTAGLGFPGVEAPLTSEELLDRLSHLKAVNKELLEALDEALENPLVFADPSWVKKATASVRLAKGE